MKPFHLILSFLLLVIALICGSIKTMSQVKNHPMDAYEQHLADSVLQYGLDHEAIYTLLGDIKPMSSLITFWYPIANTDTINKTEWKIVDREKQGMYLDKLSAVQKAINKLDLPDLRFVLVPYQAAQGDTRIVQLSVVRVSMLDSLLKAKETFFGQYGLVPGVDPVVVMSVVENARRYDRNRAYGYLFGYPDYAVDFFIEAMVKSVEENTLMPRNFFQIPVYKGDSGYFVYAYPKDHIPSAAVDSTLYHKANGVLKDYKNIRNNYLKADSTLNAYQLLKDYLQK